MTEVISVKILHLVLKKKWYEMQESGEKTEEYREITPYWYQRLYQRKKEYGYAGRLIGESRRNRDLRRTKKRLSMEKQELNFWELAVGLLLVLVACALITLFAGCTTTKYVETVRTDTVWQNHTLHDSIHVRDSVWVERWTQGDTVYVVKDRWKTEWRERLKTDTVYIAKHDTVVVKPQANADGDLSWWQKAKMRVGALVIFLMAVAVVWGIYKVSRKVLP